MRTTSSVLIVAAIVALTAFGSARADDDVPDFDGIRTPESPAFILLGVSPTQIERPNSPKQLTAALSGFLSADGVAIPKNLAVEVAPYWLWSHPELTIARYDARGVGAQLAQNATLSLATATTERTTLDAMGSPIVAADTELAFGARTMARIAGTTARVCSTDALIQAARHAAVSNQPDFPAAVAIADATKRDAAIDAIKRRVASDLATACAGGGGSATRGWILEAAAATSLRFTDSDPKDPALRATTAWLSLAYEGHGPSVVMLARGRAEQVPGGRDLMIDPGVRAIYAHGRYAVSGEVVGRIRIAETAMTEGRDHTYRVALGFDLRLTDATWFALSFGKDFAGADSGKLFSLANVKWGFGDPAIKVK